MKQLINDGWFFAKLPCGSTLEQAENAGFTPVTLPHDWLIVQDDLYESSDAWYRRETTLPEGFKGTAMLRFDGVYMDCDVILNGEVLYSHPYGYTAFDVPLTGKMRPGTNMVYVHIRHRSPNSRWYSGSGIYRDVHLVLLPEQHLVPDGISLREKETENGWTLEVNAETAGTGTMPFRCELSDHTGEIVSSADGSCFGEKASALLQIRNARPWSTEDPYLYTLTVRYGKQTEVFKIGLRSVFMDPKRGFLLNGKPIRFRGVCLHHDLGALGSAFHEKAARRQIMLMKDMGANAIRTSHNPPASSFLDLCDELGMLVVDEGFDMWERCKTEYDYSRFFPAWASTDVASWVRRDRCHPCVVMWSIGNEIYDMHADIRGTEVTRFLSETVRSHDQARHAFVTFGCNYMAWEGGQRCAAYVDAVGYNYGEKLYFAHHKEHPDWFIFGSETGSVLSSRGVYHFPMDRNIMSDDDEQCSALGNSNTSWGAENILTLILDDLRHPFSLGQFVWSGIDYIGEPTPYHTRSSYFGQADTACFPKDSYYLFQCFWTSKPVTHIGVSWDWNEGQMIDIPVITNGAEAELFLNGRSLGRKRTFPEENTYILPVWRIPFYPGELKAVSYDNRGRVLGEDARFTPGETEHLILEAEDPALLADGHDLAFIRIQAVDGNQHPVDNARDRVSIHVTGGGELAGTDNGDSTDSDGYHDCCRRLFNGKLLAIVRSNGKEEPVCVRVSGCRCGETELLLPVINADRVNKSPVIHNRRPCKEPMRIPARRIDLKAQGSCRLTPSNPLCSFHYRVLPEDAENHPITWQITNPDTIPVPNASFNVSGSIVTVRAESDGQYFLRALWGERPGKTDFISQIGFTAEGFGTKAFDAYGYISAGFYDIIEGEIGAGNEKGISFAMDGASMIGFSRIDFGESGSDTLYADIFALNSDLYELELLTGEAGEPPAFSTKLTYQKPSIWNVYQRETWRLPVRLTGIRSVCFRAYAKFHLRGFGFLQMPENEPSEISGH